MKLTSMVAAVAVMAACAGAANANITAYTSSASFEAGIAGFTQTVEDFSSGTAGQTIANGGSFDGATYATAGGPTLDGALITNQFNSFSGLSLGANQSNGAQFFFGGDSVTVTFAAPVFAVGAFFNVNLNSGSFSVAEGGNSVGVGSGAYDTSTFVFVGLVSDTAFTSATFSSIDGGAHTASFNIPEIITATTAGGVPEPATWAMMLVGFGGLGAALRRRRSIALAAA